MAADLLCQNPAGPCHATSLKCWAPSALLCHLHLLPLLHTAVAGPPEHGAGRLGGAQTCSGPACTCPSASTMAAAQPDMQQLRTACLQGNVGLALRSLSPRHHLGCLEHGSTAVEAPDEVRSTAWCQGCLRRRRRRPHRAPPPPPNATALRPLQASGTALLTAFPGDGTTLLHHLCTGEPLGLGGGLLLSLAGGRQGHGGVWPSRHPAGRAQVLALLLARQPRLALLAGSPNAAGETPLHCAVRSQSWHVLALLLAALRQLLHPPGVSGAPAALQLLVGVPNSAGLSALELAVQLRQWPAARLLAAAAGAPPPSPAQMEACRQVQSYLRQGGASRAARQLSAGPLSVSSSGSTVTEALGGLLSKLWSAFEVTPAGAATADSLAASARLEGQVQQQPQGAVEAGSSSGGGGAQGSQVLQQQAALPPQTLAPQALSQAEVLERVRQDEVRALAAATAAAAAAAQAGAGSASSSSAAAAPAPAAAASSGGLAQCLVCFEDLPPGWLSVRLPCGHATCDSCWRGILQACLDEGGYWCCSALEDRPRCRS